MNTLKKIKANQKGFTLVELIVVVAILGVLAAVAIPNYMNYLYKSRISTDVDTARAVLNVARTMTMTSGTAPSTTADVLAEADMASATAATGGSLATVLGNLDKTDANDYKFTLTLGSKAGTFTLSPNTTVSERGELPTPVKGSSSSSGSN